MHTHTHLQLNITESFNYRDLLLHEAWNGSSPAVTTLRPLFVQYQTNVSELYLRNLHQHIHTKVTFDLHNFTLTPVPALDCALTCTSPPHTHP